VHAPGFGEHRKECLRDIAAAVGAQLVSDDLGVRFEDMTLDNLGTAAKASASKDSFTIIGGAAKDGDMEKRIAHIRSQMESNPSDYEREKLQERLSKLSGGVAVIRLGAASETELKEKKARIEDALHATRAAAQEGIVPGGGVTLIRAAQDLDLSDTTLTAGQLMGVNIVRSAIEAPLRQIATNAGVDGSIIIQKVIESSGAIGFNAATCEFEDLLAAGVIDPVKVVRSSLRAAASVSSLMLTTEAMVTDDPSDLPAASADGAPPPTPMRR
ncbi:MAG: TCP-1/cpn60 chaperonin family protein, partial [Pseudomonadales bacterium]